MKRRRYKQIGAATLGWILLAVGGCGPAEPADTAPPDLRGRPIAAAAPAETATNGPAAVNAAVTANVPTTTLPAMPKSDENGVTQVGFDFLAGYIYPETNEALAPDSPPPPSRVPEAVRALSGHSVAVKGFMLPMKLQGGLVTELLLMRDQSMCCFGVVPRINEWVSVKMAGRGVKPIQDQPVTIYGTMQVGEIYENGYLVTLYALQGERMETPLDL